MANIISIVKGRTIKTVTVGDLPNGDCEMFAAGLAMEAAGETRHSLFGWDVKFYVDDDEQHIAVVTLNTD